MSFKADNVLYILECTHVMPGHRMAPGEALCFSCNESKPITGVHVYEWHAVCKTSYCKWNGRWCGLARQNANYYAASHIAANHTHETQVLYQPNPLGQKAEKRLKEAGILI